MRVRIKHNETLLMDEDNVDPAIVSAFMSEILGFTDALYRVVDRLFMPEIGVLNIYVEPIRKQD